MADLKRKNMAHTGLRSFKSFRLVWERLLFKREMSKFLKKPKSTTTITLEIILIRTLMNLPTFFQDMTSQEMGWQTLLYPIGRVALTVAISCIFLSSVKTLKSW